MVESSASSASRTRVIRLVAGIILLNAAFDAVSYSLNPDSLKTDVMRLGAITLTGLLVARGARWARVLLAILTGLAAGFAALLAITAPMSLVWRVVYFGYGLGFCGALRLSSAVLPKASLQHRLRWQKMAPNKRLKLAARVD